MDENGRAMHPDLVVSKDGKAVAVVEAKGSKVGREFRAAVKRQLQEYARLAGAEWAILADPGHVYVYRADSFEHPQGSLAIREIRAVGDRPREPLGEHGVLLTVERWLHRISQPGSDFDRTNPELKDLAESLAGSDTYSFEYGLG
jgi:hypothetical protein